MKEYLVEIQTTGMEYYYVMAESKEDAEASWFDEEPNSSEVLDYEILKIEEVDE